MNYTVPALPTWDEAQETFNRYQTWALNAGGKPTSAILFIVYLCLSISLLSALPRKLRSVHAFFVFGIVNVLTWGYFWFANAWFSPAWKLHMALLIVHAIAISGIWLVITLFGKYALGWEDKETGFITDRQRARRLSKGLEKL